VVARLPPSLECTDPILAKACSRLKTRSTNVRCSASMIIGWLFMKDRAHEQQGRHLGGARRSIGYGWLYWHCKGHERLLSEEILELLYPFGSREFTCSKPYSSSLVPSDGHLPYNEVLPMRGMRGSSRSAQMIVRCSIRRSSSAKRGFSQPGMSALPDRKAQLNK
jgi:hypothetical protein